MTRSNAKTIKNDGEPKVKIGRITALEDLLIKKARKVVTRRRTVAFRPSINANALPSPLPQLIPLRSALKMPAQPPFNARRQSFARINQSPVNRSPSSPIIPRGTAAQMILNRVNASPATPVPGTSGLSSVTLTTTTHANDVTLDSPVGAAGTSPMGRLRYSSESNYSSESD